jgi:TRAP transporter TAXI family solute receptor
MKAKKIGLVIGALFFLGSTASLFSLSPAAWAAEKCKETTYVTITDGVASASTMVVAAKWAELMSKEIPCVSANATIGSFISNALTVDQKRHTIGMSDPNSLYVTSRGTVEKFKGKETKNIRFMNAMHHGSFHIFVPKNSPIKSLREAVTKLPLKNLMVISKLAMHYTMISKIFEAYGTSFEDLIKRGGSLAYVEYAQAIDLMKDGQCDLLMIHTPAPSSVILDIDSSQGIRFLDMEPDIMKKVIHLIPGMVEVTIPKGVYRSLPRDYHTVGVYFHNFTHKDVSPDLIYQATKVFWKHEKDFQALGAWGPQIQLKDAFRGMDIPIHPGAARYYKEIGMKIPEPDPKWPW